MSNRRRSTTEAEVEFYLRGPDGQSVKVMTRPSSDRMAMYAGANILWRGDEIPFRVEKPGGTGGGEFEVRAWARRTGQVRSEERRDGKGGVRSFRYRGWPPS